MLKYLIPVILVLSNYFFFIKKYGAKNTFIGTLSDIVIFIVLMLLAVISRNVAGADVFLTVFLSLLISNFILKMFTLLGIQGLISFIFKYSDNENVIRYIAVFFIFILNYFLIYKGVFVQR